MHVSQERYFKGEKENNDTIWNISIEIATSESVLLLLHIFVNLIFFLQRLKQVVTTKEAELNVPTSAWVMFNVGQVTIMLTIHKY